jgi:type II secretory pathway pseudopilin PulG
MRLIDRIRARLTDESGYTMIAVIGAISLVSMLAAATLAATGGDVHLVQRDVDHRRAVAAAEAGIANYSFHLNTDNSYWSRCTSVPTPSAVNQMGETPLRKRPVPGSTDAEYAIELLPSSSFAEGKCNTSKPVESMLEQSGTNTGSFRIRARGYAGEASASIVATYKRASFLDYIYFTQFETSDPITYGNVSWLNNAYTQCSKFRREGRESQPIPGSGGTYCNKIVFVSGDHIEGPLHTNDDLAICGTPEFGRSAADVIEVGSSEPGWINGECESPSGANPTFKGPLVTTGPVLKPPTTNSKLEKIAGVSYTYSCQTKIELTGSTMKVTKNNGSNSTSTSTVALPSSGVVYVKAGSCQGNQWPTCGANEYSPFSASYPSGSDCGTVYVKGHYSGELTIAAQGDIVIEGNLTRDSGSQGLLGLIANNFIRVKHECSGSNFKLENLKVEAALLAIEHSFIVDHYDCGSSLGTLTVKGAISQKYRGPVGTTGTSTSTGYIKNYEYDDRLRYMEPPNFLNPVEPSWHIQRETLDYPE